jgi:1,4-alpha-glucan branching enzyme
VLKRSATKQGTKITFVLPGHDRAVSVVGDFNDWTPGSHPLTPREDGALVASAVLPKGQVTAFRYLAEDGHWFDDESADHHDGTNGYIHT